MIDLYNRIINTKELYQIYFKEIYRYLMVMEGKMQNKKPNIDAGKLLNVMFDDLAVVDGNQTMIYVTDGFLKNYKVSRDEVIGKSLDYLEENFILNPSVAKLVFENHETVIKSHQNKDGQLLTIKGIPIFDDSGNIEYVVSFYVSSDDIDVLTHERSRLTKQLEGYQQALNDLQSYIRYGMTNLRGSKYVLKEINKIKQYDVTVLFTGESGVGKTTFAKELHSNGPRAMAPFVEISCGAIPDNLLESELFGYEKGAFTGANSHGKKGLIETAAGGTLFLDEIGELPLNLQSKLLKVLQDKTISRVGGTKEISVDFRLISATNKDLKSMVKEGSFREDLFYRINVITIDIPPLREREDDKITLLGYFLDGFNLKYNRKKRMNSQCIKALSAYSWPGNIREMENLVESLVLLTDEDIIKIENLPRHIMGTEDENNDESFSYNFEGTLSEQIKEYERKIICDAVSKYRTSVMVGKKLGISQPTAARKIKEYLGK